MGSNCDNCGKKIDRPVRKETTRTRFRLAWPPIFFQDVEEVWCLKCHRPRSSSYYATQHMNDMK